MPGRGRNIQRHSTRTLSELEYPQFETASPDRNPPPQPLELTAVESTFQHGGLEAPLIQYEGGR